MWCRMNASFLVGMVLVVLAAPLYSLWQLCKCCLRVHEWVILLLPTPTIVEPLDVDALALAPVAASGVRLQQMVKTQLTSVASICPLDA